MNVFMDRDEQIASLRLIRTPNIGPTTFGLLLQRYASARAVLDAVPELAIRAAATAEIEAVEAAGAKMLFKGGDDYPRALERFDEAPPVLSARGTTALLPSPALRSVFS